MTVKKTTNGPKIVRMEKSEKPEVVKVEFTAEELELKAKLQEIDRKIDSVHNIIESIQSETEDTVFSEDVIDNIVGITAMTAATDIIGQFFGLDKMNLNDFI